MQEAPGAIRGLVVLKGSPYASGRSCSDAPQPWCYHGVGFFLLMGVHTL